MKIIRPMTINDAAFVSSNVTEDDYPAYNAGTTYALLDYAIYVVANTHWIVQSLQAGNIGHTPTGLTADTWWLKIGATNRWKMMDQSVSAQTSNASSIDVVLQASGRNDSMVLMNVSAASIRVKQTDAIDGLVYDQTYSMISTSGITDWYAYFFEPIVRLSDLAVTDMLPYNNATYEVILTDSGNTVLCGEAILGLSKNFGGTQYGMSLGITDYSLKVQGVFGDYSILQRSYRKTADMTIRIANTLVDQLQILLASYRATANVYIGADSFGASIVYGFYKDFSITVSYPTESICTISLEGLT